MGYFPGSWWLILALMSAVRAGTHKPSFSRAPSVSASCDHESFHVVVSYGNRGFQTVVGKRMLTPALAQMYNFIENGTHFSLTVPFTAPCAVFERVESLSIKSRLDVALRDPHSNVNIQDLSVACRFPSTLTECFSNGMMTVLAVKLESTPNLDPRQLTLRDPSCGPVSSDDRHALFHFSGNTCGTTRKFLANAMVYENEVSLPDHLDDPSSDDQDYELKVSCHYDADTHHSVAFATTSPSEKLFADAATGQLHIVMQVAEDPAYSIVHKDEGSPIVKFLQEPVYFEVELKSANPQVSLQLESCWATLKKDKLSQPSWNLIVDGCANPVDPYQVVFHPVSPDARVKYPHHFKRFEVQMFAFATDDDNLSEQVYVHCNAVVCDARTSTGDGLCGRRCPNQPTGGRAGYKRAATEVDDSKHVHVSTASLLMTKS